MYHTSMSIFELLPDFTTTAKRFFTCKVSCILSRPPERALAESLTQSLLYSSECCYKFVSVTTGCKSPAMQSTRICIERGEWTSDFICRRKTKTNMHVYRRYFFSTLLCYTSFPRITAYECNIHWSPCATGENWNPSISMVKSGPQNRTLFVTFDTDEHSESYKVHLKCKEHKETQNLSKVRN